MLGVSHLRRLGFTDEVDRTSRFDPFGLVLLSTGLTGAIYGTSEAPVRGWWSIQAWPYWVGGVVLLGAYGLSARTANRPWTCACFRRGQSALSMGLCVLASVAMFGVLFLLPVLVQNLQAHGALASGLVLLPQGIVMGLSAGLGRNLAGARLRAGIVAGFVAVAATSLLLVLVTVDTPYGSSHSSWRGAGSGWGW